MRGYRIYNVERNMFWDRGSCRWVKQAHAADLYSQREKDDLGDYIDGHWIFVEEDIAYSIQLLRSITITPKGNPP